jgi:hypothetical protein
MSRDSASLLDIVNAAKRVLLFAEELALLQPLLPEPDTFHTS